MLVSVLVLLINEDDEGRLVVPVLGMDEWMNESSDV
jgi:hypothetical protein